VDLIGIFPVRHVKFYGNIRDAVAAVQK
jgi:hypothetical protein